MLLKEIFEEKRTFKNPLPNISMDDNIFREVFDTLDAIVAKKRNELGQSFHADSQIREDMSDLVNVPILSLILTEPYLAEDHLRKLVETGNKGKPPSVIKYNNKFYVINGNHRIVAAYALGHESIPCFVLAVNKLK